MNLAGRHDTPKRRDAQAKPSPFGDEQNAGERVKEEREKG